LSATSPGRSTRAYVFGNRGPGSRSDGPGGRPGRADVRGGWRGHALVRARRAPPRARLPEAAPRLRTKGESAYAGHSPGSALSGWAKSVVGRPSAAVTQPSCRRKGGIRTRGGSLTPRGGHSRGCRARGAPGAIPTLLVTRLAAPAICPSLAARHAPDRPLRAPSRMDGTRWPMPTRCDSGPITPIRPRKITIPPTSIATVGQLPIVVHFRPVDRLDRCGGRLDSGCGSGTRAWMS
jgi:hypothetical protein